MKIKRKCSNCQEWNIGDIDNCVQCDTPISPSKISAVREETMNKFHAEKEKHIIETLLQNMKNHRFFLVRGFYFILYSIWTIYMIILSFIMMLVAATPG